jgi:hypothetical protein
MTSTTSIIDPMEEFDKYIPYMAYTANKSIPWNTNETFHSLTYEPAKYSFYYDTDLDLRYGV